jgi:crotonobetainyl-CoA:carnitine CoA-transferase CaiB-like acyl-CoA transferase
MPPSSWGAVGATFLRNNRSKRAVAIDLEQPVGRDLVLRLAPRFDVVAENIGAGAIERLGLGYDGKREACDDLSDDALTALREDGVIGPQEGRASQASARPFS